MLLWVYSPRLNHLTLLDSPMSTGRSILFFVCWSAYFAVPLANGMGEINGRQLILCTTAGTQVIYVDEQGASTTSQSATSHINQSCPCTQFFYDTAAVFQPNLGNLAAIASNDWQHPSPANDVLRKHSARGPPVLVS